MFYDSYLKADFESSISPSSLATSKTSSPDASAHVQTDEGIENDNADDIDDNDMNNGMTDYERFLVNKYVAKWRENINSIKIKMVKAALFYNLNLKVGININ